MTLSKAQDILGWYYLYKHYTVVNVRYSVKEITKAIDTIVKFIFNDKDRFKDDSKESSDKYKAALILRGYNAWRNGRIAGEKQSEVVWAMELLLKEKSILEGIRKEKVTAEENDKTVEETVKMDDDDYLDKLDMAKITLLNDFDDVVIIAMKGKDIFYEHTREKYFFYGLLKSFVKFIEKTQMDYYINGDTEK